MALPWLVRLRWLALLLFLALPLGSETGRGRSGPSVVFVAIILAMGLTNAVLWRAMRAWRVPRRDLAAGVLVLDTALLTGLLSLSGGASNPGTVLYLVQITFAAVLLGPPWAWTLTALSVAGFGLLFLRGSVDTGLQGHAGPADAFGTHVVGMWLAFAATGSLIAYFVGHVTGALALRERELADARAAAARNERLAALTTLAAGAAHELSTPLATIAVTAREINRAAGRGHCAACGPCAEDAALIGAEVERCHALLDRMSARARARERQAGRPLELPLALDAARDAMPAHDRGRVACATTVAGRWEGLAHDEVVGAVAALVRNALDASPGDGAVRVSAEVRDGRLLVRVEDAGSGMAADVLAHATEPFFTTKAPGQGLGLGLFLARSTAEQLGGGLDIDSKPGAGTSVTLWLPLDAGVRA
jgi:two-component system sensor histidine kinase RegB